MKLITKLYYTAPEDKYFDELKERAVQLREERYPEATGPYYAQEKIDIIKYISDNFMYIVAMFDDNNQKLLADMLTPETRRAIRERMIDGGTPEFLITF